MQIIRIVIAVILIFSAFVYISGFLFFLQYTDFYDLVFTIVAVGIFVFSAIASPTKTVLHISIYLIGTLYQIYLFSSSVYSFIHNEYFKIFDALYPLSVLMSFVILIYLAVSSTPSKSK